MSNRCLLVILCLVSSFTGGAIGGFLTTVRSVTAQEPPATPRSITAEEFRLVDVAGKVRATLAFTADGQPSLSLKDQNDVTRVWVGVAGETGAAIRDVDGKTRAILSVDERGYPSLVMRDRNHQTNSFHPVPKP